MHCSINFWIRRERCEHCRHLEIQTTERAEHFLHPEFDDQQYVNLYPCSAKHSQEYLHGGCRQRDHAHVYHCGIRHIRVVRGGILLHAPDFPEPIPDVSPCRFVPKTLLELKKFSPINNFLLGVSIHNAFYAVDKRMGFFYLQSQEIRL